MQPMPLGELAILGTKTTTTAAACRVPLEYSVGDAVGQVCPGGVLLERVRPGR